MATRRIEVLTEQKRKDLLANSPQVLPDNPSDKQFSAEQIRNKLYKGYMVLFEYLKLSQEEINRAIGDLDDVIDKIISGEIPVPVELDRAKSDQYGNVIDLTYETKSDATSKKTELQTEINKLKNGETPIAYATKAQQDASGNVITSTYETKANVNKIVSGETVVGKATKDANGNVISSTYQAVSQKGNANGYASLDSNGKVPLSQLYDAVDDIVEYPTKDDFPATGSVSKIYVALDTQKRYLWSGSQYTELTGSLVIGETTGTAFDGGRGKQCEQDILGLDSDKQDNLTETQLNAVNSGITATKLSSIDSDITSLDNSKVDKVSVGSKAYGTNASGEQTTYTLTDTPSTSYQIVLTDTSGALKVGTPTSNSHATTKSYVDSALLDKQDKLYSSGVNQNLKTINGLSLLGIGNIEVGGGGGAGVWGSITGTLSDQEDLQEALDAKQATLTSGVNIKTINGTSILGSGNISVLASVSWGAITGDITQQEDLGTALGGKLDKVAYSGTNFVYGVDSSGQKTFAYSVNVSNNSMVMRSSTGTLSTATPTSDEHATTKKYVDDAIGDITDLIPSQATSTNQLADKSFVNSTVSTNTANYIYKLNEDDEKVPFDSLAELEAQTLLPVTNNDYAFVKSTDSAGNTLYTKYKATKNESNEIVWAKEYVLNNSSFTSVQWASINSGITDSKVEDYDDHIADTDIHVTTTDKSNWDAKADQSDLDGKVNKSNTASVVYANDSTGSVSPIAYASASATANSIAQRNANGQVVVATPTADAHATTKAYVDTGLSGKQGTLSTAQLNAVNSGITAEKVASYDGLEDLLPTVTRL